jgi:hypothetical protein
MELLDAISHGITMKELDAVTISKTLRATPARA